MLTFSHYSYENTEIYRKARSLPVLLENGRKVFGPPLNYNGPRPTFNSELYISKIPVNLDELSFLVWLYRVGEVYEFRLIRNLSQGSRAYGFIRFTQPEMAMAAGELMRYLLVDGERINVFRSIGRSRLFISGIPKQISMSHLAEDLKSRFPNIQTCIMFPPKKSRLPASNADQHSRSKEEHRGFAIIEFPSHEVALKVKGQLKPYELRMWGVNLKVEWARSKHDSSGFHTQNNPPSSTQWPLSTVDYCNMLRYYCLANNWCIPIVLYGSTFIDDHCQYAGILLKNNFSKQWSILAMELITKQIYDMHKILCEVAVQLINRNGGIPHRHHLIRVPDHLCFEMVFSFKDWSCLDEKAVQDQFLCLRSIRSLVNSLNTLAVQDHEKLLSSYVQSFLTRKPLADISVMVPGTNLTQHFYSIYPKFRNNSPLENNLNDTEIVLLEELLADLKRPSSHRSEFILSQMVKSTALEQGSQKLPYFSEQYEKFDIERHSLETQSYINYNLESNDTNNQSFFLQHINLQMLETRECYHPLQRSNTNPVWISNRRSYQTSIYN